MEFLDEVSLNDVVLPPRVLKLLQNPVDVWAVVVDEVQSLLLDDKLLSWQKFLLCVGILAVHVVDEQQLL